VVPSLPFFAFVVGGAFALPLAGGGTALPLAGGGGAAFPLPGLILPLASAVLLSFADPGSGVIETPTPRTHLFVSTLSAVRRFEGL
jgi:hypothetical protein